MRKSLQRQSWRNPENSYCIWYCKMVSSTFQNRTHNPLLIGYFISRDRWKIVKHEHRCKINKRLEIKSKLPENLSSDLYEGITMFQPDKSLSVHFRPSSHGKTDIWLSNRNTSDIYQQFSDQNDTRFNSRFLKWIRTQCLTVLHICSIWIVWTILVWFWLWIWTGQRFGVTKLCPAKSVYYYSQVSLNRLASIQYWETILRSDCLYDLYIILEQIHIKCLVIGCSKEMTKIWLQKVRLNLVRPSRSFWVVLGWNFTGWNLTVGKLRLSLGLVWPEIG